MVSRFLTEAQGLNLPEQAPMAVVAREDSILTGRNLEQNTAHERGTDPSAWAWTGGDRKGGRGEGCVAEGEGKQQVLYIACIWWMYIIYIQTSSGKYMIQTRPV